MADGTPVAGSVWFYAPTNVAPIPFAVLFGASGVFHLWQCIHYKSFRVTAYLPFCCALFTAGFALREVGAFDYTNINIYLASTLLIYMSPPILELANYHILGRTLYYVPYFSPIHPGRVLTTLGSLSAIVEILNALGLAVILLFYSLAALFHRRCARAGVAHPRVRAVLYTLYISMLLILARTIYRAVEHFAAPAVAGGQADAWRSLSPIIRYEWFFWVFEAAPMLVNALMWNARHPRRYLPQSYKVYLAQDGATEVHGPGWGDKRNVVMTLVDPFGFLAMCEKGRRGEPFWEGNGYHHLLGGKGAEGQVV
ncbi:hypothetical protein C8A01DRAFT_49464 [Parachaetomium inaequale]|uniref:RTA1 domain-containing protein n=1 Tax=Parachaetomium inaequale TaxID=2588326 RepID=A0AAN6PCV7_9PEZI|nr:hypothetical protein C8A01DRAFT_49464 [Parachaetomium inaequale]